MGQRGGFRPGSGRKPKKVEQDTEKIMAQEIPWILSESALAIKAFFDDKSVSSKDKADIAAKFLTKAMPQNIHAQSTEKKYTEVIHKLESITTDELKAVIGNIRDGRSSRDLPVSSIPTESN